MNAQAVPRTPTPSLRSRFRGFIERLVPWFDREAEEEWRRGFARELATSRTIRAMADREIDRQKTLRGSFSRADRRLRR